MERSPERRDTTIGATPFNGWTRPAHRFPKGRICKHGGCRTVLSIYNPDDYCYRHDRQIMPRMRGKKIA